MQLWRWLYYDHNWISTFEETVGHQNGLRQTFCDKANQLASVDGGLLLEQVVAAKDGTRKLVFKLTEGGAAGAVSAVGHILNSAHWVVLGGLHQSAEETGVCVLSCLLIVVQLRALC